MDCDITGLFVYAGLVLLMVLYWAYCIRYVRHPRSEEWYDAADVEGAVSDGVLSYYPYGTLVLSVGSIAGLVECVTSPEVVFMVLKVAGMAAFVVGGIGFTGGVRGFRFRRLLFHIGSLTFAKQNVPEGVSADKSERGKGRIDLAPYLGAEVRWKPRPSRWSLFGLRAKQGLAGVN